MKLKNKVAIISGGASGMGASIAQLFGQEGARVVIGDIDDEKANDVALKVRMAGGHAQAQALDVVDENQVLRLADTVLQEFHRVDILVNCVGIAEFGPTAEVSLQQWRRVLDVNLTGVFLCCREVGKAMINQRSGKIVNFASTAGISGVPQMAHYTASKHGVAGLTRALAVEWGKYNIYVNCICPGATATPMLLESTTEAYRADRSKRVPLQRLGQPDEQARAALFLASPDSDYVNGSLLCVDGGVGALSPATSTDALAGET